MRGRRSSGCARCTPSPRGSCATTSCGARRRRAGGAGARGLPEIRLTTDSFAQFDSRLSFGHVPKPGTYATTVTRPDLFRAYLTEQLRLLIENHAAPVTIGPSITPMPVHFAVAAAGEITVPQEGAAAFTLRDVFDVPDLDTIDDDIVNGTWTPGADGARPLALFNAPRVDYSLARLAHYTATDPQHFQNFVLFTNYQFYVTEFEAFARRALADPESGYTEFVSTGNARLTDPEGVLETPTGCRRCRPTTSSGPIAGASPSSISAWGRPTRKRRPITSRCCARMPG